MAGGTLLSLSRHPHWFIRGWDFPRVLIASLAALSAASYLFFFAGRWYDWAFLFVVGGSILWQLYKIFPYTPLAPTPVKRARQATGKDGTFRMVVSNVQMENQAFDQWVTVVRRADPDLILAVEINEAWLEHLKAFEKDYPHHVYQPQENYYGMMLFSRLELVDPKVRYLVQNDIPSIHTSIELPGGQAIYLHGVHPRPPEPLRGQDSTPRDAEIVVMGREIDEEEKRPTLIAGDFNDVAWSHTSKLFQHLSGLLDPRRGRGLFNTFDANNPLFRFPLDHVFHSNEFKLINIELLEYVGSDHFPVLIELSYEPEGQFEQPEPEKKAGEEEEAEKKIEEVHEKKRVKKGGVSSPPPAGE